MENPRPIVYASFDRVPAAKGAATHIEANVRALGERFGSVILATPGPDDGPPRDFAPGVRQIVLGCPDDDVIGRAMTFRVKLRALLTQQAFDVIHFRSPLEGYALIGQPDARLVYEVNGLPSIEWKYHYPKLAGDDRLVRKLRHQEDACLTAASVILTVSDVNRAHLLQRGVQPAKVHVLRNGVDLDAFPYRDPPPVEGPPRVLYFGTLSRWQGIETLIDAVALAGGSLTVAGPGPRARLQELESRARRVNVPLTLTGPLSRERLVEQLHAAHACAVPLAAVDRNTVQGCCPLKLLEALAAGCPVIASDLPVVREIVSQREALLVPPDDPAGIALALGRLDPGRARAGRRRVEAMTWRASTDALIRLYECIFASRS
jgi:glycosyltransferase involved in cell wall biosynthesis